MPQNAPPNKLIKKALNKYHSGDKKTAALLYKKVLRGDPNHLDANYLLGAVLAELGQLDQALKYTQRADCIPPTSHLVKNNLGNLYRMMGDYQLAVQSFTASLQINPHFAQAYNNLGVVYHLQYQLNEAAQAYQQATSIYPGFVEAHFNLGNVLSDLALDDKALAEYKHVLTLNPNHAPTHDRMASYYIKMGNDEAAIQHLTTYLALDPNDPLGATIRLAHLGIGESPDRFPDQLVIQTYEKKARSWDEDINRANMEFLGPAHVQNAVTQFVKPAAAELSILDLGCGTGICGEFLKPYAKHLSGVDISRAMLVQAKKKADYDSLYCGEIIAHLQTRIQTYDLITASGVIIFFGKLQPLFSVIRQSLTTNGQLIGTFYKSDARDYCPRQNFHFAHSEAYIQRAANECGLRIEHFQEIVHEYDFGLAQHGYLVVFTAP